MSNKKEYLKNYYQQNKEKKNEYQKEYYKNHKQECKDRIQTWSDNNKERIREYKRRYKQSPAGKKAATIYNWKKRGLLCDNYSNLYDKYLLAEYCDVCKNKFKSRRDRCMDHDHDTGLFRQFLCQDCNRCDKWKKHVS